MIKPINVVTSNVKEELRSIEKQYVVSASKLHITINSITTFISTNNSGVTEISEDDYDRYKDEEYLRDDTVSFTQEYELEIEPVSTYYPFKDMYCEIEFEEKSTLAYLVIKAGSRLRYYDELYEDFLDFIDEQKLRENIMFYLFDVEFESSIKSLVDVIKKIKKIEFKEDKKILVSKGINEIESISSKVSMNIEEKSNIGAEDDEGKVDYANRGFLLTCEEGEQLFEFVKPQQGKHGRNCKGAIIEVEIIELDVSPEFTVDDNIEIQESFENIKYLSNKNGYLVKNGNTYDVANSIDVSEISFKTTGTIDTDLDTEISINVVKKDPLEDAIEEGMHVKVQNLFIDGSIGPLTEIEARNMSTTGQTHHESLIKCVNADIGLHKGKVIGRKVEVKTLEGGEIIADTVIVKNAVRGTIKAKTIDIQTLGSHVVMEASEYIKIEKSKGEENRFIINPLIDSGLDKSKNDDEVYFRKIETELKVLLESYKKISQQMKKNLSPCEKIKKAIIKNKNDGIDISSDLIKKFKMCKLMNVRYKKIKEDASYKKSKYKELKEKQLKQKNDVLDIKITTDTPLRGYNYIVYQLSNPDREITLNTDDTMTKKVFKLIEDEDGILKIINSNH